MRSRAPLLAALLALAALFVLTACAPGANPAVGTIGTDGQLSGFWAGLWHGIISPVTLILSWFTDRISLYEVHNRGGLYDLGFALGTGILFGGIWRTKK